MLSIQWKNRSSVSGT